MMRVDGHLCVAAIGGEELARAVVLGLDETTLDYWTERVIVARANARDTEATAHDLAVAS